MVLPSLAQALPETGLSLALFPAWKTTFDGRQPLIEENLCWETILDGRPPLMEDNL